MRRCWNDEPTARPTFDELVVWIDSVISNARPGSRPDTSRLYLNVARHNVARHSAPPTPPSHSQSAADVAPGVSRPELSNDDDDVVEDELR